MRHIEIRDGLVVLHSDFEDRRAIGLHVTAARWHKQTRTWQAPATPAVWQAVRAWVSHTQEGG